MVLNRVSHLFLHVAQKFQHVSGTQNASWTTLGSSVLEETSKKKKLQFLNNQYLLWLIWYSHCKQLPFSYYFISIVWRIRDCHGQPHGYLHHHEPRLRRPYRAAGECEGPVQTRGGYRSWSPADLRDHVVLWGIPLRQGMFTLNVNCYCLSEKLYIENSMCLCELRLNKCAMSLGHAFLVINKE